MRIVLLTLGIVLSSLVISFGQKDFEGIILTKYILETDEKPNEKVEDFDILVKKYLKGNKAYVEVYSMEYDMPIGQIFYNKQKHEYFAKIDARGNTRTISGNTKDERTQQMVNRTKMMNARFKEEVQIATSEETKKIGNLNCVEYIMQSNRGESSLWFTNGYTNDFGDLEVLIDMMPMFRGIQRNLFPEKGTLMEMITTDPDNIYSAQFTTVIEKKLEAEIFEIKE